MSAESEVLDLAALGLTNKEIAHRLGIAQQTVKNHLASAYDDLGVDNRLDALVRSGRLVRPGEPVPVIPECGQPARCTRHAGHRGQHGGWRK